MFSCPSTIATLKSSSLPLLLLPREVYLAFTSKEMLQSPGQLYIRIGKGASLSLALFRLYHDASRVTFKFLVENAAYRLFLLVVHLFSLALTHLRDACVLSASETQHAFGDLEYRRITLTTGSKKNILFKTKPVYGIGDPEVRNGPRAARSILDRLRRALSDHLPFVLVPKVERRVCSGRAQAHK